MNVYDTANRLASEIKESEEYVNYKMASCDYTKFDLIKIV